MAKSVREISAKAFVKDLRSGMKEDDILSKYSLSRQRLHLILKKLVDAKALGQTEVDAWLSAPDTAEQFGDAANSTEVPLAQIAGPRRLRIPRKPPETTALPDSEMEPTRDRPDAGSAGYRLKLYGRLSSDSDAVAADLAAVLGIDVQQARDYLDRVPVTVKEGLPGEKAERLRSILLSVGALCLVEPMDGADQQPISAPSREGSIADALLMRPAKADDDTGIFPSRVKPSLLVLFSVILFLSIAGIYLVSTTRTATEEFALKGPVQKNPTHMAQSEQVIKDEDALPAVKSQISALEGELPTLMSRLTKEKAAFDLLVKTPGVEYDELQKQKFAIDDVQDQLALIHWQIRTLKKEAAMLERHTVSAEKREPAPQPTE